MPHHIELVNKAKEAIHKVFIDTSVTKDITQESLKELQDEIDSLLDTIDD